MYTKVEDYILRSREERREHLRLTDECILIGGSGSSEYKALLAHFLKTTIPTKNRFIQLCHACNNPVCSNPQHLYWGTYKDNHVDRVEAGEPTIKEKLIKKYGVNYHQFFNKVGMAKGGGHNKLNDDDLEKYKEVFASLDLSKRGWIAEAVRRLNVTHTHVRRMAKRLGFVKENLPQ